MIQETVNSMELSLPLNFLRSYIASVDQRVGDDTEIDETWQIHFKSNSESNGNATTSTGVLKTFPKDLGRDEIYILFVFGEIKLGIINKKVSCKITNIVKINNVKVEPSLPYGQNSVLKLTDTNLNTETNALSSNVSDNVSPISLVKRRRGRPRKEEQTETKIKVSACTDNISDGYNLRKVRYKLPPSIVQLETGSDKNDFVDAIDTVKIETDKHQQLSTEFQTGELSNISGQEPIVSQFNSESTNYPEGGEENVQVASQKSETKSLLNFKNKQNLKVFEKRKTERKLENHPALKHITPTARKKRTLTRTAECKYCKRLFCDYTGVDFHVKKYHQHEDDIQEYLLELKPLKQMICSSCNEVLTDRLAHNVHFSNVHGKSDTAVCTCASCGKSFKNVFRLKIHVRQIHENKKTYHLCHLCPSKFLNAATLKQHIEEIHDQIRNVSCEICNKMFYRASQLNRHKRIHQEDEEKFVCQECGRKFRFRHNLQRHADVMHRQKSTQESFHCSYCGHGFRQKSSMVAHVRLTHFSMHTFLCDICKTSFQRSRLLTQHMASVHGVHDFQVNRSRRLSYKYHRSPEDLYYCQFCSSSFYYKAKLVEHMHSVHANAFPHVCKECNQGFLEKSFLTNHISKAHSMDVEELQDENADSKSTEDVMRLKQLLKLNENTEHQQMSGMSCPGKKETKGKTSVIVEVANSSRTVQYVIEGSDEVESEQAAHCMVQDITNLLLAAEHSLQDLTSGEQDQSVQDLQIGEQDLLVQDLAQAEQDPSFSDLRSADQEKSLQLLTLPEHKLEVLSHDKKQSVEVLTSSEQEMIHQDLSPGEQDQNYPVFISTEKKKTLGSTLCEQDYRKHIVRSCKFSHRDQNVISSEQDQDNSDQSPDVVSEEIVIASSVVEVETVNNNHCKL